MKLTCLCLAVSFLLPAANAQVGKSDNARNTEGKLIAMENAWNVAQKEHDTKAMSAMVAETFVDTESDGSVLSKAEFLSDIANKSFQITFLGNDGVQVSLYKDVAVVTGAYHVKGTNKGKAFDHSGRFTDTWILQDNRWQCIASHSSLKTSSGS